MKSVSSENIVFVPLKVKHIEYIQHMFESLSTVSESEQDISIANHLANLLKVLDII